MLREWAERASEIRGLRYNLNMETVPVLEVVSEEEWLRRGRELRRVDPLRYAQLAEIVDKVVRAYTDPLSLSLDESIDDSHVAATFRGSA